MSTVAVLCPVLGYTEYVVKALNSISKKETFLFPAGPVSVALLLTSELLHKVVHHSFCLIKFGLVHCLAVGKVFLLINIMQYGAFL